MREAGRGVGPALGEFGPVVLEDAAQELGGVVASKRALTGQRFVEDGAEGVQVAATIDGSLCKQLLGGHVARGAEQARALAPSTVEWVELGRLADAEVDQRHGETLVHHREQNVLGLEIAMDVASS